MMTKENQLLLRECAKIADALGKTLAPLVEVVLHDLTQPEHSIISITNNLSGRKVGDPTTEIGLSRIADSKFPEILQNYPNRFPDGRPAKSTSIGLKNSKGEYVAALCLNVDISALSMLNNTLTQLCQIELPQQSIVENLAAPSTNLIRDTLKNYAAQLNTAPHALSVKQRKEAVQQLSQAGLMELKNAQAIVAEVLGVARSTIYTYLPNHKEMR